MAVRRNGSDAAFTRRLEIVAERMGQAEIARRTGISRQNVNRYVKGTRPPLDFGADLATELGVNPTWLLTGQGKPFLEDLTDGAGRLAGDLLDVLNALNAVAQSRLGSLGGKHHLRILRDLNSAMSRHRGLYEKLDAHSVPVLRSVLRELRAALAKPDLEAARALCRTSEQLARLCDDADLILEQAVLQGRLHLMEGDLPLALEQTRRAIGLAFRRGGTLEVQEFEVVAECVATLRYWMRFPEALRVAKAAFALASDGARNSGVAHWLTALVGDMQVLNGEIVDGLALLKQARGKLTGMQAMQFDAFETRARLLAGEVTVAEAVRAKPASIQRAAAILGCATFLENEHEIELAINHWCGIPGADGNQWQCGYARMLLRAMRGETKGLEADVRSFVEQSPGCSSLPPITGPIFGAGLYRLLGRTANARGCFRAATRLIAGLPSWLNLSLLWVARHERNALTLAAPGRRKEAKKFFRRHVKGGYQAFTRLAELGL